MKETPLILDPGGSRDPRKHIVFRDQFPKGKTIFGKKTISICGLDRDALNNYRKELIEKIDLYVCVLVTKTSHSLKDVAKAKTFYLNCDQDGAEYSTMASDYKQAKYSNLVII
jgi:hypothetical protein